MDNNQVNPFDNQTNKSADKTDVAAQPATGNSGNEPKKKSKLGLILGLSIGGAVLIAILVVVLVFVLGGVSKKDFADAKQDAQNIVTMENKYNNELYNATKVLSKGDVEDSEVSEISDQMKTYRSEMKSSLAKLGDAKAIKKDKEANEKFQTFKTKYEALGEKVDVVIEVYDKIIPELLPAVREMSNVSSSNYQDLGAKMTTAGKTMQNANISDKEVNDAFKQIGDIYVCLGDAYEAKDYSALLACDSSKLSKMQNPFSLNDASKEATDALNNLGEYLTSKANE